MAYCICIVCEGLFMIPCRDFSNFDWGEARMAGRAKWKGLLDCVHVVTQERSYWGAVGSVRGHMPASPSALRKKCEGWG